VKTLTYKGRRTVSSEGPEILSEAEKRYKMECLLRMVNAAKTLNASHAPYFAVTASITSTRPLPRRHAFKATQA
jgi:hypothetical protein